MQKEQSGFCPYIPAVLFQLITKRNQNLRKCLSIIRSKLCTKLLVKVELLMGEGQNEQKKISQSYFSILKHGKKNENQKESVHFQGLVVIIDEHENGRNMQNY